ncbi:MAG: hypothetical protein WC871_05220 [Bacteroidales bacterium]|jgi:endonuclease YncB( thermonuclease family)
MKKPLFLLLLIFSAITLQAQTFKVKVVSVSDGDTFTALNRDDLQIRFRIYGIDAPEREQAFSSVSTDKLTEMIHGKK